MIDIAEQLFPNLLTLLTQLAATGIIYLLYRKYVHTHVISYLDKQTAELNRAQNYAKEVEIEAEKKAQTLEEDHQKKISQLRQTEQLLRKEAEAERQLILKRTAEERELMLEEGRNEIEKNRIQLLQEVEKHVLDLAVTLTEKTLEHYTFDDEELFKVLEAELEQMHNETN